MADPPPHRAWDAGGHECPHFPVKETESLWKSQRVSETMNKTQHSGIQVRTFSLKSKRQTLKHALCVWSREVCVIHVPVCGVHACVCPQVLVGVFRCECVVCAHVCESTGLHEVPSASFTAPRTPSAPARARLPFVLPTPGVQPAVHGQPSGCASRTEEAEGLATSSPGPYRGASAPLFTEDSGRV